MIYWLRVLFEHWRDERRVRHAAEAALEQALRGAPGGARFFGEGPP